MDYSFSIPQQHGFDTTIYVPQRFPQRFVFSRVSACSVRKVKMFSTHHTWYPLADHPSTRSRKFSEREVDYLLRILGAPRRLPNLSTREYYLLDQLRYEIKERGYFRGYPPWPHPYRLGPFAMLTFRFPGSWVSSSSSKPKPHLRRSESRAFRQGLCGILDDLPGHDSILGYRLCPHTGVESGQHVHVLLSLLTFPQHLNHWAKAFRGQSDAIKSTWLPHFFIGPHLDTESLLPSLHGSYGELLHRFFGEFEDDPQKLVHVRTTWEEPSTLREREIASTYGDNCWKHLKEVEIIGFYPRDRDREVLLRRADDTKYTRSLHRFIRCYLLYPRDRWLRRGSLGFLHGRRHLSAVLDYAAKEPHPTEARRCYLDITPGELVHLAQRARIRHRPTDPPVPHESPVPEELLPMTKKSTKQPFPWLNSPICCKGGRSCVSIYWCPRAVGPSASCPSCCSMLAITPPFC